MFCIRVRIHTRFSSVPGGVSQSLTTLCVDVRLTPYTPYQEEIGQGRLESLLNFQTLVMDLTCMDVANASLLDEASSASEALAMTYRHNKRDRWFVADNVHPQTLSVVRTRASALGINVHVGDPSRTDFKPYSGVLLQYPDTYGHLVDYEETVRKAHDDGVRAYSARITHVTLISCQSGVFKGSVIRG